MLSLPTPISDLIAALNRLPGVGPRTAERLALHVVQTDPELARHLAQALLAARERTRTCDRCGGLTEQQPCAVCADPRRDSSTICVVERPVDILLIERTGAYRGCFHVLGGKLSPLDGVGPEDLQIAELESRLKAEPVREVILALSTDLEGDATSSYLAKRLKDSGVRVSRIARGLPAGTGLEFADEMTLNRAMEDRQPIS